MPLSQKQILSFNQATKRFNIWVGAVRSGKTYSSILKLIDHLKHGPQGDVMIIGVNRESIQRNILGQLYQFLGLPPPSTKTNESNLYGRRIYFVGAHDEGAVRRIQGSTLSAAYVDECTCVPEPFFKMLETRLSIKGAQLFATANPEHPGHWLKKSYIDRSDEIDIAHWHFNLDDNPILDEKYKEQIRKSLTGAFYKRFVLGEWAASSGLIYDAYDTELNEYTNLPMHPNWRAVGIDYGTSDATAAVMIGVSPKIWPQIRVEKEYYWDSRKEGRSKTDAELADDIQQWISYNSVQAIYVDPSAASLKLELRRRDLPVIDANNDVLFGIRIVSKFITERSMVIHKSCKILREHIQGYLWDPKATDKGKDKPLHEVSHINDALRYVIASSFKNGDINNPDENLSIAQIRAQVYGEQYDPLGLAGGFGAGGYM